MNWYGNDISGWGYALMTIGMLAFWGLVIGGVVLLVRKPDRSDSTDFLLTPRTSHRILAERFARGEIDEDEYTGRLAALREQVRP